MTWVCKEDQHAKTCTSFGYTNCCSSSNHRAVAILSNTTVKRSAIDQEDLKPYWKSVINKPIIHKFFKDFTKHRMKTNRVGDFICKLLLQHSYIRWGPQIRHILKSFFQFLQEQPLKDMELEEKDEKDIRKLFRKIPRWKGIN